MEYRLNKDHLLNVLEEWNRFLKRKVHLIACGGTAMCATILPGHRSMENGLKIEGIPGLT